MLRGIQRCLALGVMISASVQAERLVIASDMVNSTSTNLIIHNNVFEGTFGSAGDAFEKLSVGGSTPIPFALLDESAAGFPTDTGGIVSEFDTDEFFGAVDTRNIDNPNLDGNVNATWVFDISESLVSGTTAIEVAIDIAAMGDFESSDEFTITASVDGGSEVTLFELITDNEGSQVYTMDGGAEVTLNDPLTLDGVNLTNEFVTFTRSVAAVGSELTLTLTGKKDGGSEAVAFRNIEVAIEPFVESVIAFDMVDSGELNLLEHVNAFEDAFGSAGDTFQKLNVGGSAPVPFALVDESVSGFPSDTMGIISEFDTDTFFGIVDTVNSDTSGPVSASWTFDVAGETGLGVIVDIAAMGDFESNDTITLTASVDGGADVSLFNFSVDEAISLAYTMDGGAEVTLNDPLTVDGAALTNEFATFRSGISGEGSELTVTLTANTNGGSEAVAFRNLEIVSGFGGIQPGDDPTDPIDPEEPIVVQRLISEIQGTGEASVLAGEEVKVTAIVVGDFQDGSGAHGDLKGFFLQEESVDFDADPNTSEGLFVFEGNTSLADLQLGDKITIVASVSEFNGMTQLSNVSSITVLSSESLNETSLVDIALPTTNVVSVGDELLADLEQYEGMWVRFAQSLTVSELFNLDRFGEMRLIQGTRPYQFTQLNVPDTVGYQAHLEDLARRSVTLDDGLTVQNPDPIRYPAPGLSTDNPVRMGDEVTNLEGVLLYAFGQYRMLPTAVEPVFTQPNPRPDRPDVGGTLTVSAYNVLNFFNTLDDGSSCFSGSCRGADTQAEFNRQLEKLVTAFVELDADIIGLIEIENDYVEGPNSAVATLVAAINADERERKCTTYDYVNPGSRIGGDAIAVGLMYCADTVEIKAGSSIEILDDSDLPGLGLSDNPSVFNDPGTNRAALATSFTELATGESLTISVNHFKSKGSSCGAGDDSPENGQANCNLTRVRASEALHTWLATDPTSSGDPDFLIMGDLNAYAKEDPLVELEDNGYTNVISDPAAYSFTFDGQIGSLDHGLATASLLEQMNTAAEWNINSDEADALDYNLDFGRSATMFDGSVPYRSSDHDPLIMGFNLASGPLVGDLDGDGDIDYLDTRAFFRALRAGEEFGLEYDFNDDGVVNTLDYRILRTMCTRSRCRT